MNLRPWRTLRELDRQLDELSEADRNAEEWARLELTRSASTFSRETKRVMDDTVSLSATLLRAGEVEEASRLMAVIEQEVKTEEAALIETVNEVKAAGAVRRRRMARLKLVKAVATAALSGSMFMLSAAGVVVARGLTAEDGAVAVPGLPESSEADTVAAADTRRVTVAPGIKLSLTPAEVKELSQLTADLDAEGLREFLAGIVPSKMLDEVHDALLEAVAEALGPIALPEQIHVDLPPVREIVQASAPKPPKEERSPEPSPEPSSTPEDPSPEPEPEPQPEPSGDDPKDDDKGGDGGVGSDGPLGGLPKPGAHLP